jgi:hypothetical protein
MADGQYRRLFIGGGFFTILTEPRRWGWGGARPNSGGKRLGAGRPRKNPDVPHKPRARVKPCAFCGVDYTPTKMFLNCCSDACKKQFSRSCGHPKPLLKNGRPRQYCFDCKPGPPVKPRKAHQYQLESSGAKAFCAYPECGREFSPKLKAQRFCSRSCSTRESNRQKTLRGGTSDRGRAMRYGCDYQPVDRGKVFERDGWVCYLCGAPTPRELRGKNHPRAPHADHVIPLTRGGSHTYGNMRCSCQLCNLSKRDMTPEEFLAKRAQQTLANGSRSP